MSDPLPAIPDHRLKRALRIPYPEQPTVSDAQGARSKEPVERLKKAGKKIPPRTDIGTILLHWCFAAAFTWVLLTGLRVASDNDNLAWLRVLDRVLPASQLWPDHVLGANILSAVAIAYVVYISTAKLFPRVKLDGSRLSSVIYSNKARWGILNVFLYWMFFLSFITCLITGWLLYSGFGGFVLLVHRHSIWTLAAFPFLHAFTQLRLGGLAQLTRVFRPSKLQKPAPALDLAELVADLLAQQAKPEQTGVHQEERRKHG